MIISCLGHSKFLIELADGYRLVTDPYDATVGYPITPVQADVALISHHHHDHDAVDTVQVGEVIDQAGNRQLTAKASVHSIRTWHDEVQGNKRGQNLVHCLHAEGLKVAHLGDLGHVPTEAQLRALGPVDVVLVPVGGYFTIDAAAAKEVCSLLKARVILPMHYRTQVNADWPIAPVEDFLALYPQPAERLRELRITAEDLSCQPHVAILEPLSLS